MEQSKKKTGSRKQITFDLSQKALSENYPRPKLSINPKFYKKAYADISRFMKKNGFEHRQFSVYTSIDKVTNTDINLLMDNLAKEMPWLTLCVNQIDVTNIGTQHSLLQTLEAATALQVEQTQEKKTNLSPELVPKQEKLSMKERMAAAQAESDRRSSSAAADQHHNKNHDLEK